MSMNGYQRVMAALRGEQPDAIPIMLHNFMPAAREAGYSMREYRMDAAAIANTFIQAVETYEYDGIVVDIDTATLAEAVGVPIDFPDDEPARCRAGCIDDLRQVPDLPPSDITGKNRIPIWLDAVRKLRRYFGDEIAIRGNADQAPFSLASMMRSPAAWMMDLTDDACYRYVVQLLEYCTQATCQFVRLMAEAGAHITSNGDSPAGPEIISPEMYRTFALPCERFVAAAAHDARLPYILHICGNTQAILADMVESGLMDWSLTTKRMPHLLVKYWMIEPPSSEISIRAVFWREARLPMSSRRPESCCSCSPILPVLSSMLVALCQRQPRPRISTP